METLRFFAGSDAQTGRSEDAAALAQRTRLNAEGDFDLPCWLAQHLTLPADARLLDVGAGTGTVLTRFAATLGPHARCFALDVSSTAMQQLQKLQLSCPLAVQHAEMERLIEPDFWPEAHALTHITAIYSFYYARDPAALLAALARRLAPGGVLAVAGPAPGNNADWYGFLAEAGAPVPAAVWATGEHFPAAVLRPGAAALFRHHHEQTATNRVQLGSPAALLAYWRSTIYHDPRAEAGVQAAAAAWFERHAVFEITKKIGLFCMEQPR